MGEYSYHYQSIIHFSAPVSRHFFRLRCLPCRNACQQVRDERLQMHPAVSLHHDTDAFGNRVQYGHALEPHDAFVFTSSGTVSLSPYRLPEAEPAYIFRLESRLTTSSKEMEEFLRPLLPPAGESGALPTALRLSDALWHRLAYSPGITGTETTAAAAFALGRGVCQDYAHIFIALCRRCGIPARYVNGFMTGTGATHAWAEIYTDGAWLGIDPTHNRTIETGYIKIAHGRDAADCPVNRGIFVGASGQSTEVRVIVMPAAT